MKKEQFLKNLSVPKERVDVILDTDTFNEVDDQFALCYMLASGDRMNVKGICAAPFFNHHSTSAGDGMERSYNEIMKLLSFLKRDDIKEMVYKGSDSFLTDEKAPVISPAAEFIAETAKGYSPENPLYIIAIGAITNVASAILLNPDIKENCVIVWLGGHAHSYPHGATEFNMRGDMAAARIVLGSGVPLIQLPCNGVVDKFFISKPELLYWLKGKNELCDYLVDIVIAEAESYAKGLPWTRIIWDVTAVAWLLNDDERFMKEMTASAPIPEYDGEYGFDENRHEIKYVYKIKRDALMADLIEKLGALK